MRTLGETRLKTGESLRIAAVRAPAGRYARPIRRLLEHKGPPWMLHVDLANQGQTDALRTAYYVGLLGTRIVGNVMIVDDGRVGILGHVFTAPEHRRKGICQRLMATALGDFRARGGVVLTLGTGYNSAPYGIYQGFGFRGVEAGNGHMLLEVQPGDLSRYFEPSATRVADGRWEHWPGISLLYMNLEGDRIRSMAHGVVGPDGFEGGFLDFQTRRASRAAQLRVLLSSTNAVVGAAILQRDTRWPRFVHILDLYVHPNFRGQESGLVRGLSLPRDAKVQAYLDHPSSGRRKALHDLGFRHEATLRRQLPAESGRINVLIYSLAT